MRGVVEVNPKRGLRWNLLERTHNIRPVLIKGPTLEKS